MLFGRAPIYMLREWIGANMDARLIAWRDEPAITRIERPTKLERARRLGWRAKQGYVVARVRVARGLRKQPERAGGRRPKRSGRYYSVGKARRQIAEERANRAFPNMEVLSSYLVAGDGPHQWFEVILIDPAHPVIQADRRTSWVKRQPGRAFRGLTAAGKRARGLQ